MEAASSLRLVFSLFLLLAATAQEADAAFHIVPSRLQLFAYESVSFTCRGFNVSAGWKVMNVRESIPCSGDSCSIEVALEPDSGEYWCEAGGERSGSVSISVAAGPVVLESPVLPVPEGDAVTLSCRDKMASSNLTAHFYRDGLLIGTSSTGSMSIHRVSKSDEGLYRCGSGAGESAESRLTVTEGGVILESPAHPVTEGEAVTLSCRKEGTDEPAVTLEAPVLPVAEGEAASFRCRLTASPGDVPAVFYKDGVFIGTSSTGTMSLLRVHKSHEGLYRCNVSGAGQSAGRRLVVTETTSGGAAVTPADPGSKLLSVLPAVVSVVCVAVLLLLLLLVVGLLQCRRHRGHVENAAEYTTVFYTTVTTKEDADSSLTFKCPWMWKHKKSDAGIS